MTPAGWRWSLLAALAGFSASLLLSGTLHWSRGAFVAGWSAIALVFLGFYQWTERIDLRLQLHRHWKAGLVTGVLVGALLWIQVTSQPASSRAAGRQLLEQLAGYGVLYGTVDAVMLSVIPVLTLYGARATQLQTGTTRLRLAVTALAGSALVTAAYHLGFEEYRGPTLAGPLLGNLIMTVGYLVSGSPIAPVLSHVLMHVAAVLHGIDTTTQIPPHA